MEDKLLYWVKDKCIEVQQLYGFYVIYREQLQERANKLRESSFYVVAVADTARDMNNYYAKYAQGLRDVSQVCHLLGGEYLEIFNQYFGEESEEQEDA